MTLCYLSNMNVKTARSITRRALDCNWPHPERHLMGLLKEPVLLLKLFMNSMKLAIPLHSLYRSIHTKDESKRGTAFAFIFGVN